MPKLIRAWVETHMSVNGKKFYTGHIMFRNDFLWIIPFYYTENVFRSFQFYDKIYAEDTLLDVIDQRLSEIDSKVLKSLPLRRG